jgi:hypothetical protein
MRRLRAGALAGCLALVGAVAVAAPVRGDQATAAGTAPRPASPLPTVHLELDAPELGPPGAGAFVMPRVRPRLPGPIPIPEIEPAEPGAVPMPEAGRGADVLVPSPPQSPGPLPVLPGQD